MYHIDICICVYKCDTFNHIDVLLIPFGIMIFQPLEIYLLCPFRWNCSPWFQIFYLSTVSSSASHLTVIWCDFDIPLDSRIFVTVSHSAVALMYRNFHFLMLIKRNRAFPRPIIYLHARRTAFLTAVPQYYAYRNF